MPAHARSDNAARSVRVATCHVRALGVPLAIACPESLLPLVADRLSPWHPRIDLRAAADVDAQIDFRILDSSPAASADDLLAGLQHWMDREITRRAADVTPVHAGVVAWRERALLLAAPSGAGKTTLVRALVAQGARYYSDELAFIDAGGCVHPYPRRMMVRDDDGVSRALASPAEPEALPPVPVGLILGLTFDPDAAAGDAPLHLQRLAASESLLWLLANTPRALTSMRDLPAGLLRAAAMAESWRGTRGGAREAAAAILRFAEPPSSPARDPR